MILSVSTVTKLSAIPMFLLRYYICAKSCSKNRKQNQKGNSINIVTLIDDLEKGSMTSLKTKMGIPAEKKE